MGTKLVIERANISIIISIFIFSYHVHLKYNIVATLIQGLLHIFDKIKTSKGLIKTAKVPIYLNRKTETGHLCRKKWGTYAYKKLHKIMKLKMI